MAVRSGRNAPLFVGASALFLFSGATGLAYEVIWFKRFAHVWGNSTMAMGAVVASFLFGLGVGAHVLGKLADRVRAPLLWYGLSEVAIGVLALIIPYEISWLAGAAAALYPYFQGQPPLLYAARFLLTALIIGPPCLLMGGTLPFLVKELTPVEPRARGATGWLYAVNTLGAAFGTYLTGFHLLPSLGLFWTNSITAGLNLAIGVTAVALSRRASRVPVDHRGEEPVPGTAVVGAESPGVPVYAAGVIYFASACTGCAALILQMVWTRQLALILGGSTYAFTSMLFVVLVGIGLGSMAFRSWCEGEPNLFRSMAGMTILLVVTSTIGSLLIPQLTMLVGSVHDLRGSQAFNAWVSVAVSAALEFVPAVCMGFLFPLFVQAAGGAARDLGKTVGNIYAWNTAGTLLGAALTSSLLIPNLGSDTAVALALALYLAALITLVPRNERFGRLTRFGLALAGCGLFFCLSMHDPRVTNIGMYLYGFRSPKALSTLKVLSFREGPSCNVLVLEHERGLRSLRVNGKVDASNSGDMNTQLGSAYLPRFLNPGAKKVLVIGFGSGTTAGASLLFPGTTVKCCEIEPAVFAASRYFADVNHSPEKSPHFTSIIEDGRNYLQGSPETFDLIISEPSNPWIAGLGNLFTREYYLAAKSRLAPGGVLLQWIQLYNFSASDYALVARTVRTVFPECALMRTTLGDTLLLASMTRLAADPKTIAQSQSLVDSLPAVKSDLLKHFGTADVRSLLLSHWLLSNEGLNRLVKSDHASTINTDLNLRLEFDAPLRLFQPQKDDILKSLVASSEASWFVETFKRWDCSREQLGALRKVTERYAESDERRLARPIVDFALEVEPSNTFFRVERMILTGPNDRDTSRESLDRIASGSATDGNRLGLWLWRLKEHKRSAMVYERLLASHAGSVTAWVNLGKNYQALERWEQAEIAFRKAASLDPLNEDVVRPLEELHRERAAKGVRGHERPPGHQLSSNE